MSAAGGSLAQLRAAFPVLRRLAFLNAGTNGPVAAASSAAARAELEREEGEGRAGMAHFGRLTELRDALRAGYAARLGCAPEDVALTTSTTDGIGRALLAFDLGPDDEILTAGGEHPGVLGPLSAQQERGVRVRIAPIEQIPEAVTPETRLVVCSHVSWRAGGLAPAALAALAELDVPLLLDGAQGVGAVPTDVAALGADFYAGSGQKWLCGPDGTGMLYVSPEMRRRLRPPAPGYTALVDPAAGLDAVPHRDARAFDAPAFSAASLAHAVAALEVLDAAGWDAIHTHAARLAETAAAALAERRAVVERDRTTLVSWWEPDAAAVVERLAGEGVVVRSFPGEGRIRASFGGWNSEDDLDRLLAALPR